MSFFRSLFGSNLNPVNKWRSLPQFKKSIYLESVDAYLMCIMYDNEVIYLNDKDSSLFVSNNDGTSDFQGRVYKLIIEQRDGHRWFFFYGILTDDPMSLMLDYSWIALEIVKEVLTKIPGLLNPQLITKLPTEYVYTMWTIRNKYLISNFSGSDSYAVKNNQVLLGDRDDLLDFMRSRD